MCIYADTPRTVNWSDLEYLGTDPGDPIPSIPKKQVARRNDANELNGAHNYNDTAPGVK